MSNETRIVDFAGTSRKLLLQGMCDVFETVRKPVNPAGYL